MSCNNIDFYDVVLQSMVTYETLSIIKETDLDKLKI